MTINMCLRQLNWFKTDRKSYLSTASATIEFKIQAHIEHPRDPGPQISQPSMDLLKMEQRTFLFHFICRGRRSRSSSSWRVETSMADALIIIENRLMIEQIWFDISFPKKESKWPNRNECLQTDNSITYSKLLISTDQLKNCLLLDCSS